MRIRFGWCTSSWWVSRVIRFFCRAKVSHAFLILESTELGDLILEAGWDGWRISTPANLTSGTTRIVATVDCPPDMVIPVHAAVVASIKDLGERYDYEGLFGMAWVSVGRWLGKKWKNPLRSSKAMFCSDAVVAEILQPAKWPGADKLDPQSVSPEELAEFLGADLSGGVHG